MITSYPVGRTRKEANMCAAKTPDKEGPSDQTTPSTTPSSSSSSSPPLLLRKESCGDLQSRLKTRKMLGVGEDDDGEIHRSKISQILGRSEHLKTRLPTGLRTWQVLSAATITALALVVS
ncbi:tumor protein p53-inducible protein 11-like [Branchiostoma lanceolatum]|uniref:tumor protein p53-inducible protein 11-like n=1 Tax=Branchiostoma lanceolatum TaxID=7740 RepID=UPI003454EA73